MTPSRHAKADTKLAVEVAQRLPVLWIGREQGRRLGVERDTGSVPIVSHATAYAPADWMRIAKSTIEAVPRPPAVDVPRITLPSRRKVADVDDTCNHLQTIPVREKTDTESVADGACRGANERGCNLGDDRITERAKHSHPSGYPMSQRTKVGLSWPPLPVGAVEPLNVVPSTCLETRPFTGSPRCEQSPSFQSRLVGVPQNESIPCAISGTVARPSAILLRITSRLLLLLFSSEARGIGHAERAASLIVI